MSNDRSNENNTVSDINNDINKHEKETGINIEEERAKLKKLRDHYGREYSKLWNKKNKDRKKELNVVLKCDLCEGKYKRYSKMMHESGKRHRVIAELKEKLNPENTKIINNVMNIFSNE